MFELILLIALIGFSLLRELLSFYNHRQWTAERKDLLDRIMAKDLNQYKDNLPLTEEVAGVPQSGPVDIEDAREELLDGPEDPEYS